MNTYIIISAFTNYVSGAPIYHRNKLKFLENLGWRIVAVSVDPGEVYIDGLKKFSKISFPFIRKHPNEFPKKIRYELLELIQSYIDFKGDGQCIIETGTDYTAYWGELLASYMKAKHIVFFLDENNKNVTFQHMAFFDFKHKRREFACINSKITKKFFEGYKIISDYEAYSIIAYCNNSVEPINNEFSRSIERKEFNIGSIGRLEKVFVQTIIDGILEFAKKHDDVEIQILFLGGAENTVIENIKKQFELIKNVRLKISGYIFPIPQSVVQKMDVFFSGSGSALASANQGVATIAMDVNNGKPIGYVLDTNEAMFFNDNNLSKQVIDYLNENFYKSDTIPKCKVKNINEEWEIICKEFHRQMDFINKTCGVIEYYDIEKLPLDIKQKIRKVIRFLIGEQLYFKIFKKY